MWCWQNIYDSTYVYIGVGMRLRFFFLRLNSREYVEMGEIATQILQPSFIGSFWVATPSQ